jgi:hypothetical protein
MRHNERVKFFLTAFRRKICDIKIGQLFIPKHTEKKKMYKSKLIWKKLNGFSRILASGLIGLLVVISLNSAVNAQTAVRPSAKFEKIWVDYNITENGVKGMRIHTKFTVYGMKNVASYLAIFFETGDGKRLRDNNKSFYSTAGDVAIYKELSIAYDPGAYDDLVVFMPYDELDLSEGEYDLKMSVNLIYKTGEMIQNLTKYAFVFTQPKRVTTVVEAPLPESIEETPTATKTLEKVWVDYDVFENGRKGMRIHVKFTVRDLKDVESDLRIRVARKSEEFLKSTNSLYSNSAGELLVIRKLKPGYQLTVFEDEKLFLPYDEIKLGRGVFDLKLDLDLTYRNGELIEHMGWHDFVYRNGVN